MFFALLYGVGWKTRKRSTVTLDSSAFDSISSLSDDDMTKGELPVQPSLRQHRRSGSSSSNTLVDNKPGVAPEANRDKKLIRCDMLK